MRQRLGSYYEEQKRKVFTQRGVIDFLPMCAPEYLFAWTHPEMYHLKCYFFCNSLQSNAWNRGQSALSECPTNIVAYTIPNSLLTALSSPGIKKHATTDLLRNFSTLSSGQTQQRATQVDTQVHQNLSSVVKLRMKELVRNLSPFWLYQALFPKEYVPCFKIWEKMVVSVKDFVV